MNKKGSCRIYKDKNSDWNLLWYEIGKSLPVSILAKTKKVLVSKARKLKFDFYFNNYSNKKVSLN